MFKKKKEKKKRHIKLNIAQELFYFFTNLVSANKGTLLD